METGTNAQDRPAGILLVCSTVLVPLCLSIIFGWMRWGRGRSFTIHENGFSYTSGSSTLRRRWNDARDLFWAEIVSGFGPKRRIFRQYHIVFKDGRSLKLGHPAEAYGWGGEFSDSEVLHRNLSAVFRREVDPLKKVAANNPKWIPLSIRGRLPIPSRN